MLLLSEQQNIQAAMVNGFSDHLDPTVRSFLPSGVHIVRDTNDMPDLLLLRYRSQDGQNAGGMLHVGLALDPLSAELLAQVSAAGGQALMVAFDSGYARLRLRSVQTEETSDQTGDWHSITIAGSEITAATVGLTIHETQILQALLDDQTHVVEIELDLRYRGLIAGIPWLVSTQIKELYALLSALLVGPVVVEQIVMAFLSLPQSAGLLTWQALEPDVAEPARETILTELALRSLDQFFIREANSVGSAPAKYQLQLQLNQDTPTYSWDLSSYRQEQRRHALTWSLAEIQADLADPQRSQLLFPALGGLDLFGNVAICLVNHLAFDPAALREVRVDLRYIGAAGVLETHTIRFDGSANVARLTASYPALTHSFALEYRITSVLAPLGGAGWPRTTRRDWVPAKGTLVEVSRASTGVDLLHIVAEARIFEHTALINLACLPVAAADATQIKPLAQVQLSADHLDVWLALSDYDPDAAIHVTADAQAPNQPDSPSYRLLDGVFSQRELRIAAYQLEVLEPDRITIMLADDAATRYAYVAVVLATLTGESKYISLAPGMPKLWSCFRPSVFEPLQYRYQIEYVAYDDAQHTLPIVATEWFLASDHTLLIEPLGQHQEQPV